MIIFKERKTVSKFIQLYRSRSQKTGFVPTMGALHAGHLSLVQASKKENALTVCSIFVNPTQFHNADDLKNYPVTIESDIEALIDAGCDVLFLPEKEEMYPDGTNHEHYDLGYLETILEGKYRPGHFQGVCQIVDRLLETVQPDNLYMGQKDFQQCKVVEKLLQLTGRGSVQLKALPTVRENDGLAMSSRNLRLSAGQREHASNLSETLCFIKDNIGHRPKNDLLAEAFDRLKKKGFVVDYLEVVNANTLLPDEKANQQQVAVVAATIGNIRLIDNCLL